MDPRNRDKQPLITLSVIPLHPSILRHVRIHPTVRIHSATVIHSTVPNHSTTWGKDSTVPNHSTGKDSSQNVIFVTIGKLPRKTTFLPGKHGKIPLDAKMTFCEESLPV